jgi:hypothetical protein
VHDCTTACRAYDVCQYEKGGKCKLMKTYLETTEAMLLRNFEKQMDETKLYRIGMHLMPLYRILCRLKIEEVGFTRIIYTTDKGNYKLNPAVKGILDTITRIEQTWKTLGLDSSVIPIPEVPHPSSGKTSKTIPMMRNPHSTSYYSQIESGEGGKAKRMVRRKKKANGEGD